MELLIPQVPKPLRSTSCLFSNLEITLIHSVFFKRISLQGEKPRQIWDMHISVYVSVCHKIFLNSLNITETKRRTDVSNIFHYDIFYESKWIGREERTGTCPDIGRKYRRK